LSQSQVLRSSPRVSSQEGFESIFHTYYGRVFALAYRLVGSAQEAEDIAQEAFLRLYLRPLPSGREHNVAGWLLTVAANLGYNRLRSGRRRQERENRLASTAGQAEDPDEAVVTADVADRVRKTLSRLPERQAQILLLRHSGLSYAEVATAMKVAPGSVGTLLARAERAFRAAYDAMEASRDG
jgi:RNA polymerase sigma-70 factor, ECF subfamily